MSRRGTSPVLIGRAEQLAALEDAFEAIRQGGPATVLVGGEAGVGKTRLISEFTTTARQSGARVMIGGCLELGADGLPFGPFTAVLRDLVRELGPEGVANLLPGGGGSIRELARLLPELPVRAASPADGTVAGAGEARARLFEEFLTLLERLAEPARLVVVIEDAHWADRSSRDLLAFLVRYQRALRNTLIVVTFRSDELHRTHPLRPLLAELARVDWAERIEVPRLTREQAAELVTAIQGGEQSPELTDRLYRRSEGNPLFTEELLCCDGGQAGDIPDSLADLLLQAVRRLPEDTQEVLRIASAGSGASGHALLARVTGLGSDELTQAIRPAVIGNVLVTTDDGYAFRHALIREAVHEDLLPGEHGRVHARFADAIDAEPALVPDGRAEVEKAHHWHAAQDTTWALISAWQAASHSRNSVALAERLMLLARVLELWDRVPDASARIGADHVRVLEEAAGTAYDAGELQRGLAFASTAISELDEAADPVRLAQLLRRRHRIREDLGLAGSLADLERALPLVPAEVSPRARAEVLIDYGHCGNVLGSATYRTMTEEALRLAREIGDVAVEAEAVTSLAMSIAGPGSQAGPGSEPIALIEQASQAMRQATTYRPVRKVAVCESHLLCGAGEYERAAAVARAGIEDAERHGLARTFGAFLAMNVAEPLLALGRWDEALGVAERALLLAPPPLTRVGLWICTGLIAVARGDVAEAGRRAGAVQAILDSARYEDQHNLPHAVLDLAARQAADGPVAAAELAMAMLDRLDLATSSPRYAWPLLVTALNAAVSAGDSAAELLERLRSVTEKLEAFGPVQEAYRLMFRAGDPRSDPPGGRLAAWDEVAAAWDALRQPYETAMALLSGSRAALSGSGSALVTRESAAQRLHRAARIADDLGARPLAAQIADLGRRAGITLPAPGGDISPGGDVSPGGDGGAPAPRLGLTAREFEVLRLLAEGQSNREIAAALFISPKTASVHVSNILGKLGTATRTEAAAKAHALHLFG